MIFADHYEAQSEISSKKLGNWLVTNLPFLKIGSLLILSGENGLLMH